MPGNLSYLDPIPGERWRVVKGAEDYEVSDHGRVRSYKKLIKAYGRRRIEMTRDAKERGEKAAQWLEPLMLKPKHTDLKNKNHGWSVALFDDDGSETQVRVSHLVWEAFVGPIPAGFQVWHAEDYTDNQVGNLYLKEEPEPARDLVS